VAPPDVRDRGTVAAYLAKWLGGLDVRPRTAASYADAVRLYIVPTHGHIQLAKLQGEDIDRMTARLNARGDLSSSTGRYAYSVLRIALGEALRSRPVARNAALEARPPRVTRPERSPLTLDQVATFLEHVEGDRLAPLYKVAIGLGLRQGEMLALRWSDVNLDAGTLAVRRTRNARGELAAPKTERSRRALRLGAELTAALRGPPGRAAR
jgi:integrase